MTAGGAGIPRAGVEGVGTAPLALPKDPAMPAPRPAARRSAPLLLALLALLATVLGAPPATAQEAPGPVYEDWEWADAATAPIHPGVQTRVDGAQCTSNFIFVQLEEVEGVTYLVDVLLGSAGHCAATTGNADECTDEALPVGHPVDVDGAVGQATVAYNASLTMIRVDEQDRDACFNNDFALYRLAREDWARVNPSLPTFGGPVAVAEGGTVALEDVYSWGNSSLRRGIEATSPKQGISFGTDAGGWNHNVTTVTPGIPGDSGSGYLDADGNALGVVSTVETAPFPASNNVTDLERSLDYARTHEPALAAVQLEPGTEPFDPNALLPVG